MNKTLQVNGDIYKELFQISRRINSNIHRVYYGKIIPDVGIHYLNVLSQSIDPMLVVLFYYWDILEQNSFSTDFKTLIITSHVDNPKDTYNDMIKQIKRAKIGDMFNHNFTFSLSGSDQTHEVKGKENKLDKITKKESLIIISRNDDIQKTIDQFSPDLILIDEIMFDSTFPINTQRVKKFYQFLNNLCSDIEPKNIAVISFTKFLDVDKMIQDTNLINISVCHRCKTITERIADNNTDINLKLIKLNPDKIDEQQIIETLDEVMKNRYKNINSNNDHDLDKIIPMKKIIVLTKTNKNAQTLSKLYRKTYMKYHGLLDVVPYDASNEEEIKKFQDLYVHNLTTRFLDKKTHKRILKESIKNCTDNGILFMCTHDLNKLIETNKLSLLKNVDCLLLLDDTLKSDIQKYNFLLMTLISNEIYNSSTSRDDMELSLIEILEKNLHKQLHRLGTTLYSHNKTNVEIFELIRENINSDMISMDVEFNDMRRDKLERMFKITQADRKNHNRNNTIYIVPVPKPRSSQIRQQYLVETEYFESNVAISVLRNQMDLIKKAKSKEYFGPKWLGTFEKQEIPGNKIGFLDEHKKEIKVCEIIDVHKFGRRDKRSEWKEKENRDKNILFLSPVINKIKLSKFKKETGVSKYESIDYMQEFVVEL